MRRRPRFLVLGPIALVAVVAYAAIPKPTRDAVELGAYSAVAGVRAELSDARRKAPKPAVAPIVRAYLRREMDIAGRADGARVARFDAPADRSHLVVERGRRHGLRRGDLAVVPTARGDQLVLLGDVTELSDSFARIRTLLDETAWWLAATAETRFSVTRGGEAWLRVRVPERKTLLTDRALVITAEDLRPARPVPSGLSIGRLEREQKTGRFRVRLAREPGSVLAVRFLRDGRLLTLQRGASTASLGTWHLAEVVQPVDANALRHASLVRWRKGLGSSEGAVAAVHGERPALDAPVARGPYLEGWTHTRSGDQMRVRLLADPGFYVHVLVLRAAEDELIRVGSTVFRGLGRQRDRGGALHGLLRPFGAEVRAGDRIVVGPHKGTGGVGLLVGEVVHWSPRGPVTLKRALRLACGDDLWVGAFPRPPDDFEPD